MKGAGTLFDRRTQASLSTLRILNENYPDNLWQAFIPIDTRLRDASRGRGSRRRNTTARVAG